MAHQLSAEIWPRQPLWFAEGLANFLEPVFYADDEKNVVLGGVNFDALREYKGVRTVGIADALAWKAGLATLAQREAAGLYGFSWLFVHWLYNTHTKELTRYLEELERGSAPDVAFETAMKTIDLTTVDQDLFEYQKHGEFEESMRPLVETPLPPGSIRETLLDQFAVKEVKDVLEAASKRHLKPSHEGTSSNESAVAAPAARPKPKPAIDYKALPVLQQYRCPSENADTKAGNEKATVPAKSTVSGKPPKGAPSAASEAGTPEGNAAPEKGGTLSPEVIQRVIRASYGTFRKCYEEGLKKNPNLGGLVKVRFVIDKDGSVRSGAEAVCPTLPDPAVIDCIVKGFGALRFPKPAGNGIVTVIYPNTYMPE
jgi:hypothetical protein